MVTRQLPPPRNLDRAMAGSAPLAGLLAGHRQSQACFQLILPRLPAAIRPMVRPGPIDEGCWTLFAEHAAAASKLRQLLPLLLDAVTAHERSVRELKVKILPRSG